MRARFSLAAIAAITLSTANAADPAKGVDYFENKIRPVLVEQCYKCHSDDAKKFKGGLAVDTKAGLLQGGDTGPAIVPGDAKKSLLIKGMKHDGLKMPNETTKLSDAVIADFEAWVTNGAVDPREGKSTAKKGRSAVEGDAGVLQRPEVHGIRLLPWGHRDVFVPRPRGQRRDGVRPERGRDDEGHDRPAPDGRPDTGPPRHREHDRRASFP